MKIEAKRVSLHFLLVSDCIRENRTYSIQLGKTIEVEESQSTHPLYPESITDYRLLITEYRARIHKHLRPATVFYGYKIQKLPSPNSGFHSIATAWSGT